MSGVIQVPLCCPFYACQRLMVLVHDPQLYAIFAVVRGVLPDALTRVVFPMVSTLSFQRSVSIVLLCRPVVLYQSVLVLFGSSGSVSSRALVSHHSQKQATTATPRSKSRVVGLADDR